MALNPLVPPSIVSPSEKVPVGADASSWVEAVTCFLTYSGNNIHTFSTSVAGANVTISMTATNTANVAADQYVYDVEYTQSDGTTVERVCQGIITCSAESTK